MNSFKSLALAMRGTTESLISHSADDAMMQFVDNVGVDEDNNNSRVLVHTWTLCGFVTVFVCTLLPLTDRSIETIEKDKHTRHGLRFGLCSGGSTQCVFVHTTVLNDCVE